MIPGVHVGHVTDLRSLTGCTAILPERPAVGALEIAGWAAGVHGIEFLDPRHVAPTLDGVVLAGGSAFGLEAVWGVMQYLEEHGRGFPVTRTVVPHVAGAIIFDLNVGDHRTRPDRAMGYSGDVRDPVTGRLIAGARDAADGTRLVDSAAALEAGAPPPRFRPVNTTIGVIATTAALGKAEAARVARLGLQGFERALSPPHLPTDGDALFCLSVGDARTDLASLGGAAAEAVAAAIARAVLCATSLPGLPAASDLFARNS